MKVEPGMPLSLCKVLGKHFCGVFGDKISNDIKRCILKIHLHMCLEKREDLGEAKVIGNGYPCYKNWD